jgi:uncharacterized protein YraI
MNRQTRKMLLNIATGVAVAATAALVFLPAANAAPGTATGNVNVRSGPGTGYAVVDTLRRGDTVDVQRCQGSWCYVVKPGPDGWVSASYLSAGGRPVNPSQPGLSFGFSVGPDGPSFNFGIGQQPQQPQRPPQRPRPPVIQPVAAEACFFESTRYRGPSFCMERGDSIRNLGDWTDRISSIRNTDGLQITVCSETNFRNCRTYTTSATSLGDYDDYIMSIRIR